MSDLQVKISTDARALLVQEHLARYPNFRRQAVASFIRSTFSMARDLQKILDYGGVMSDEAKKAADYIVERIDKHFEYSFGKPMLPPLIAENCADTHETPDLT